MIERRVGLVGGLVVALLLGGGMVAKARYDDRCGGHDDVVRGRAVPRTLLTPRQLAVRHDARLARLTKAAARWPAPFGPVVGGAGFDYGRPLTLAGLPTGLGVWTSAGPVFGVLGPDLTPLWGIRDSRDAHAWDASGSRFLGISLRGSGAPEFSAYDARTGRRLWCTRIGGPLDREDPLATAMSPAGGVLVLAGKPGHLRLTMLDASGTQTWSRAAGGVDEGDYLGTAPFGYVAGGRPAYELGDLAALSARDTVTAFDPQGKPLWEYHSAAGSATHVLGVDGDTTVLLEVARSSRVLGLDESGQVVWSVPVAAHADTAVADGSVVVRSGGALLGLDGESGRRLWRTPLPTGHQVFPYGFELDQQPMLDDSHLLLGATQALLSVDVRTGAERRYPLPTDGVSTTYWPYQVVVTPGLVGVVTNTGAVVLARRG